MYNDAYFCLDLISYYGVILYNWCFTVAFVYQLIRINSKSVIMNSRMRNRTIVLIGNGIGHAVTSSFANLYRALMITDLAAFPIWMFILIVGLHFWFNSKIELLWEMLLTCSFKKARILATSQGIDNFGFQSIKKSKGSSKNRKSRMVRVQESLVVPFVDVNYTEQQSGTTSTMSNIAKVGTLIEEKLPTIRDFQ
jgi:hypothetical protein